MLLDNSDGSHMSLARLLPRLTARGLHGACNVLRKPNRASGEETAPSGSAWSASMRSTRFMGEPYETILSQAEAPAASGLTRDGPANGTSASVARLLSDS